MKKIILNGNNGKGKFALVDDENFEVLNKKKWHLSKLGYAYNQIYVKGSGRKNQKSIGTYMHRLIMEPSQNLDIDHINGDKLDNQRNNLRIVTMSQNLMNSKIRIDNRSGFKGVQWHKQTKSWRARIRVNNKSISLGLFKNLIEAALAYNNAAIRYFGEFARLNIIPPKN